MSSSSGFRINEAVSLKWENVDFVLNRIILENKKAKRKEEFPLYDVLKDFMLEFNKSGGSVFGYKAIDGLKFWSRGMKILGFDYTLHNLRKTFATELVNGSVSVFDAMKLLRHKNVETTMKYYTYADLSRIGEEANKIFSKINQSK